jgi:hypothetical protein
MFCCRGLEILIGNVGQRAFSVLVYFTSRGFCFYLKFGATSRKAELLLLHNPTALQIRNNISISGEQIEQNISMSGRLLMTYCPFVAPS